MLGIALHLVCDDGRWDRLGQHGRRAKDQGVRASDAVVRVHHRDVLHLDPPFGPHRAHRAHASAAAEAYRGVSTEQGGRSGGGRMLRDAELHATDACLEAVARLKGHLGLVAGSEQDRDARLAAWGSAAMTRLPL